ncbi:hypothetical protein APD39_05950 [Acinetobacter pittii]|uniref:hypothetical protein n=1 Tax=Acinetobacter pittii TaxID=48296 RepID=UPI000707CDE6|nr:hypothetical protein [Acinetobacter pittii]KQE20987.1 hypothetical protein APD38_09900 [Acinetobacter pittii]KQE28448.1 hypothetical protein APD39_05950 [Acinetobacter pittii]PSD73947.1 hypothetical protein C7G49_13855 [Acinetobacter pittii]
MDKCREAFERFECEKYEANYDDMKKNWDWYESQFGYRYSPDSLRGKGWAIWQEAWQHQQAKVEELKASHHGEVIGHEVHFKKIKQERDELQTLYIQQGINMLKLQKRVDALTQTMEEVLEEMKYPTATFEEVIVCGVKVLEQALKGEGQ